MAIRIKSTRFAVFDGSVRVGVIIPRNDSEWVFLYLAVPGPNGTFLAYFGDSPESAISQCPYIHLDSFPDRTVYKFFK